MMQGNASVSVGFYFNAILTCRVLSVLSAGYHSAYKDYEKNPDLSKSYSLSSENKVFFYFFCVKFNFSSPSLSIKDAANAAGFYNDIAADKLSEEHPT